MQSIKLVNFLPGPVTAFCCGFTSFGRTVVLGAIAFFVEDGVVSQVIRFEMIGFAGKRSWANQ